METLKNPSAEVSYGSNERKPILRNNFILMIISGLLIITGFFLMTGASSEPTGYNPDIFSSRRIVAGPLLSFIGYVLMAIAIIIKPKKSNL